MSRPKKDCMFQYAHKKLGILGYSYSGYDIVEDTGLITFEEAVELWEKYKSDFIRHHQEGGNPEMVIWSDCPDETTYVPDFAHVDGQTEVIGDRLYIVKKELVEPSMMVKEGA
jgi:hypothetical protein